MKRFVFVLTLASLMMLLSAPTYAVSEIVLDEVTGLWAGDTVLSGCSVEFTFRLTNTDGNGIRGMTNGFRVWTHRYGAYTNNFGFVSGDTLPLGWDHMFSTVFAIMAFSIDGVGEDTVGFGGSGLMGPGIPDGFDQQVWRVRATPYMDGDTLCIDSSFFPPGGEWIWATGAGTIYPGWDGPHCFLVWECCVGVRGNVDGLAGINIVDLIYLVEYLFYSGPAPRCDGDADGDGETNVADVTYLVEFLFFDGPAPPPCP